MVPGVSFRIVQPNVPQEQKWREDNARQILDDLEQMSTVPTPEQPQGIGGIMFTMAQLGITPGTTPPAAPTANR